MSLGLRVYIITTNYDTARRTSIPKDKILFGKKNINIIKFDVLKQHSLFLKVLAFKFFYTKEIKIFLEKNIHRFDYICTQGPFTYLTYKAIKEAYKKQIPIAYHMRGMLQKTHLKKNFFVKMIFYHFVEKKNLMRSNLLVALSKNELQTYQDLIPNKKKVLIPNVVVRNNIKDQVIPALIKLEKKDILLSYIGRIDPWKRIDLLLDVFHEVRKSYYGNVYLVIAGHQNKQYLNQLLIQKEKGKNVIILPFLDIPQKKYLLKRTKVFIYFSKGEGLSMSILESLQSKVPVVCTNECNLPEINKYKCGFNSVSNKNILAKNVLSLITSRKKYISAKMNTQAVVKLFEKERVARLWKKNFLS